MTTVKSEKSKKFAASEVMDNFIKNIEVLRWFVKYIKPEAAAHDVAINNELEKLKKAIGDDLRSIPERITEPAEEGGSRKATLQLSEEEIEKTVQKIIDISQDYQKLWWLISGEVEVLHRSALIMLASYFDCFLSDLISGYYIIHPEGLDKELSISASELRSCADIEEALELIVNKKIENISYKGLEDQKAFMKNFLKIDLKENLIDWNLINETIERRNILVHNNGIINNRYLKRVSVSGVQEESQTIKLGERLIVSDEYFNKVIDEILVASVILMQICWRKWMKDSAKDADRNLLSHFFPMKVLGQYDVLKRLGLFAKEIKVHGDGTRHELDMYYCLAIKEKGESAKLKEELSKFDESTLTPHEMLYVSGLKNDIASFYENLKKPDSVKGMIKTEFLRDPIFKDFRSNDSYEKMIEEAIGHGKDVS
jgi:hypothetical protein